MNWDIFGWICFTVLAIVFIYTEVKRLKRPTSSKDSQTKEQKSEKN